MKKFPRLKLSALLTAAVTLTISCKRPIIEVEPTPIQAHTSGIPFKAYLGINAFEWNFSSAQHPAQIDENNFQIMKSFSGFRHYLEWDRIESREGSYTFSPVHSGGWDYDKIYQRMKDSGKYVLIDIKSCPTWLLATYPENDRDAENVPAPYGLNRSLPASYIQQARAAFQLAARYGSNQKIDTSLLKINTAPRWPNDTRNERKVGLGTVSYIECDNERDKWWKGSKAEQSAEEYAANLSAFYDGHQGKLGKGVGVKAADPNMQVVMGGLATANPAYVVKMINWCLNNRGRRADGKIDLCFDIINYHLYSNDSFKNNGNATRGIAPELSNLASVASSFMEMSKKNADGIPVWMTETGYDSGEHTSQRAIAIGNKSALVTQADWNLRSALLFARAGIAKCIFYMLDNVDVYSYTQYTSSGFINPNGSRRPSGDYFIQALNLLGEYHYVSTTNKDPMVDLYQLDDKKIYVLSIPDEVGRTAEHMLNLGTAKQVTVYTLNVGSNEMIKKVINTQNGMLQIQVSETPVFVQVN